MSAMTERMDAKDELTPDQGFNLVGFDDYEEPGDELYLIAHFDTRAEADAALRERQSADEDEVLYVYGSEDADGGEDEGDMNDDYAGPAKKKAEEKKEEHPKPGEPSSARYSTRRRGAEGHEYVYEEDDARDKDARFVVAGDTKEGAHYERPQDSEHFGAFTQWRGARKKGLEGKSIPKHLVDGAVKHAERHHYDSPTHHQAYDDYLAHQEGQEGAMAPPSHKPKPRGEGDGKKKSGGKKDPIEMVGKIAAGDLDIDPFEQLVPRLPPDAGAVDVDRHSIDRNGLEYGPVGASAVDFEQQYFQHYGALHRSSDPIDALAPLAKARGHKYKSRERVGDHYVYHYDDGSKEHGEDREARLWHEKARAHKERTGQWPKGYAVEPEDEARLRQGEPGADERIRDRQKSREQAGMPPTGTPDNPKGGQHGKYTDKRGVRHEHPESKKQLKWSFAAEERGELPKGTAEKWARRFYHKSDGSYELVKGLFSFDLMNQANALAVPEPLLYDYLCSFVEEAVEHERRECQHKGAVTPEALATPVLHELVQFVPKNKNLKRAVEKYKVTAAAIAQIIADKKMLAEIPRPVGNDMASLIAMGAVGDRGPTGEVMLASRRYRWVQGSRPEAPDLLRSDGPRLIALEDDQVLVAPAALHKSQFRLQFDEGEMRRFSESCLLHGNIHRDQIAHQPYVTCSCG